MRSIIKAKVTVSTLTNRARFDDPHGMTATFVLVVRHTSAGIVGLAGSRAGVAVDPIIAYLAESRDVVQAAIDDPAFCAAVRDISEIVTGALRGGGKLLLAGNGGSAGDAQHLAGEILSRLNYDRAPGAAIALTTDSSVLTAIANDYGYDRVFERQILGLGRAGDVLIAISTSGRSPNILRAIAAAREKGLSVVGLTGKSGGEMPPLCDVCLRVPSDSTPVIQQIHITAGHIICGLVEQRLSPPARMK